METGITHIYELAGSKGGITLEVTVQEQYDAMENTSDLTVGLRVKSSSYYDYIYYLNGTLALEGNTLVTMRSAVPTHYVKPVALNTYAPVENWSEGYTGSPWGVAGIVHNTDGSRSVRLEISLKGYTSGGGGGSGWSVADSREIPLTHIPRANTVGASDAFVGSVSTVSVVRKSADYTHSVAYAFGSLTGWLDADGSLRQQEVRVTQSSIPFTVPEEFYYEIPDSPSGVCTLTCRTYREQEQVGDAQTCTFTVTAKRELCAPAVSGSVTDGNPETLALTGDGSKLVRFHSTGVCAITAAAQNGASVTEKTIAGEAVTGNTLELSAVETGSVTFTATDSRGYSTAVTVDRELIPYIRLTANVTLRRTHPTNGQALLTVTGNCYSGSFGAAENALTLTCRVDGGEPVALTPVWKDNAYTLQTVLTGLDYQTTHCVEVTVADCLEQAVKTAGVGKGIPVFDWGETDFRFNVPVALPQLTVDGQSLGAYIQAILEGG